MGKYVPSTSEEQQEMLKAVGVSSFDELYTVVPSGMKVDRLAIPEGKSELEVSGIVRAMAAKNKVYSSIFRGAGAYNHYIPSIVKSITGKEEFLTAYTPYQAEISQGILQSIFEYQTMICELTDMDVSNASVYDGASAAAEAMAMCHNRKKKKTVISGAANPMTIQTIQTYCEGNNTEAVVVPAKDGKTDLKALMEAMDQTTSGVFIQQPSYFGQIEDAAAIGEAVHAAGAKFHVGILGYMGTYFFLLSSYYGAINRLADGGEARYRGYRLAAASGPLLVLVLLAHSVRTLGDGACLTYALLCLPIAPTLYFSIKHLILPDVDLGIIRVMRPYNACVIVFCMVQVLLQAPACSGLDIRAAGSVLSSVLLMTLLPMAEMGVRKWFI